MENANNNLNEGLSWARCLGRPVIVNSVAKTLVTVDYEYRASKERYIQVYAGGKRIGGYYSSVEAAMLVAEKIANKL